MSIAPKKIRTLIVDDSALVRKVMADSLAPFPDIEVVGTAIDPYNARDQILKLKPDVMTLDIEMPRMDGLSFLRIVMERRPMPVIIISSLTTAGSQKAMEALRLGAIDVMAKPHGSRSADTDGRRLANMIRAAAGARLRTEPPTPATNIASTQVESPSPATTCRVKVENPVQRSSRNLILIGASTGGTEAIARIFKDLPPTLPGICIVQHIPAYFSRTFAERLNQTSQVSVKEAEDGDIVSPGHAYVAPGGHHMMVKWVGSRHVIRLNDGPLVHHQRPAVDVMYDSVVKTGSARYSLATILTGMGADGAQGMAKLKAEGALTAAQDQESCVVYGMPREAVKLDAPLHVLPLDQMAGFISTHAPQAFAHAPVEA